MTFCGHQAVLLVTQDVADTSTSIARERIELRCDLEQGHAGPHRDSARGEGWEGREGRRPTLLRDMTETSASTRAALAAVSGESSSDEAHEDDEVFDCLTCGACCYQRPGTILVEAADLVRWRRIGREDILAELEPGHFGQMAFKMASHGACVHHGTDEEPHACQ